MEHFGMNEAEAQGQQEVRPTVGKQSQRGLLLAFSALSLPAVFGGNAYASPFARTLPSLVPTQTAAPSAPTQEELENQKDFTFESTSEEVESLSDEAVGAFDNRKQQVEEVPGYREEETFESADPVKVGPETPPLPEPPTPDLSEPQESSTADPWLVDITSVKTHHLTEPHVNILTLRKLQWLGYYRGTIPNLTGLTERGRENYEYLKDTKVQAFLAAIRYGEGTYDVDGYRRKFGGGEFTSYADHPMTVYHRLSSAAGAYQIMDYSWPAKKNALGLLDFTPMSQDIAAVEFLRDKGALQDVLSGNFETAVYKVSTVWASLPFTTGKSYYNYKGQAYHRHGGRPQPAKPMAALRAVYDKALTGDMPSSGLYLPWDLEAEQALFLFQYEYDVRADGVLTNETKLALFNGVWGTSGVGQRMPLAANPSVLWEGEPLNKVGQTVGNQRVTSTMGIRNHPVHGGVTFHSGVDMSHVNKAIKAVGTRVVAWYDPKGGGLVIDQYVPGSMKLVRVLHASEVMGMSVEEVKAAGTVAWDLSLDNLGVSTIGFTGNSGVGTAAHSHTTVKEFGRYKIPSTNLVEYLFDNT